MHNICLSPSRVIPKYNSKQTSVSYMERFIGSDLTLQILFLLTGQFSKATPGQWSCLCGRGKFNVTSRSIGRNLNNSKYQKVVHKCRRNMVIELVGV